MASAIALGSVGAAPADAAAADPVYPIRFPVVGDNHFSDTYDACRDGCSRRHHATDIMAAKGTPVVAAAAGAVSWIGTGDYTPRSPSCGPTAPSYYIRITHDDGYQSWYIHLNNDTEGTDDGLGRGIAPGIETGARVEAGQLIGWVGDSGNAECVSPHLHFQLHYPDGSIFNPYKSLRAATPVDPLAADEIFFYRADGLFRYYKANDDGTIASPLASGDNYTRNWTTITAVDLDGDGADEIFFYREDGLFRYYDIRPDGTIPKPMRAGDNYTRHWTSITAVDLDGDGDDEMFFYREDGLFRYYDIRPDGTIPKPMRAGDNYTTGWNAILAVDIDGDGGDEMFFYRQDGEYRYYDVDATGAIGSPIQSGSGYERGWTVITAIDLDGDLRDELLFYRPDGTFAFHRLNSDGALGEVINSGANWTTNWDAITSLNLDS